jgi:hypothetical protein
VQCLSLIARPKRFVATAGCSISSGKPNFSDCQMTLI